MPELVEPLVLVAAAEGLAEVADIGPEVVELVEPVEPAGPVGLAGFAEVGKSVLDMSVADRFRYRFLYRLNAFHY